MLHQQSIQPAFWTLPSPCLSPHLQPDPGHIKVLVGATIKNETIKESPVS